ncbi:hypothetical protein NDU88_000797 [Pleurodeles waltl]|uniref:Uncharacterized protein n=1 Tax=Pleurodeles waltl TaxID=8319 RepID=A0AAV7VXK9_PLEWA|nr:hypothetical protein NDU88_000797 [Pleurodeles waltl]
MSKLVGENRTLFNTCLDVQANPRDAIEAFSSLSKVIEVVLNRSSNSHAGKRKDWFDKEGSNTDKALMHALQKPRRIPQEVAQCSRAYRKAVKARKNILKMKVRKDLEEASLRENHEAHWGIVNRLFLREVEESFIEIATPGPEWASFFGAVYVAAPREEGASKYKVYPLQI